MKDFYLTLPSRGDKNKISSFTVDLPYENNLEGTWEVGLVEVLYPTSWYNIHEGNNKVSICYAGINDDTKLPHCYERESKSFCITVGFYDQATDVVQHLNRIMETFIKKRLPELGGFYVDDEGYVRYNKSFDCVMTIHQDIADMLGHKDFMFGTHAKTAEMHPNFVMQNLYLYTDIIQPQIVGNVRAPLLAIIPAQERNLKPARYTTHLIQYLPLQRHNFNSIHVNIRDVTGKHVAFASGHSVVKLHFRQQK